MQRATSRLTRSAVAMVGILGLVACGTPTPYQPALDGRGYAEQAIEDDRYRISFSGNTLTSRETAETYMLYRAAEITLQRRYDHFVVVDSGVERRTTFVSTTTGFGSLAGFRSFHRGSPFGFGGFATTTSRSRDRYEAFANIVMRSGDKPSDDPDAYDAQNVLETLAPTITLAETP